MAVQGSAKGFNSNSREDLDRNHKDISSEKVEDHIGSKSTRHRKKQTPSLKRVSFVASIAWWWWVSYTPLFNKSIFSRDPMLFKIQAPHNCGSYPTSYSLASVPRCKLMVNGCVNDSIWKRLGLTNRGVDKIIQGWTTTLGDTNEEVMNPPCLVHHCKV
jgi:hypothetical protein